MPLNLRVSLSGTQSCFYRYILFTRVQYRNDLPLSSEFDFGVPPPKWDGVPHVCTTHLLSFLASPPLSTLLKGDTGDIFTSITLESRAIESSQCIKVPITQRVHTHTHKMVGLGL